MRFYLHYRDNKIIGCSNCINISDEFECKEVSEERYNNYLENLKDINSNKDKLNQLKNWFETYYSSHEQKYRRFHTLNLKCEDGSDPQDKLIELYNLAEEKRDEIKKLETSINN